MERRDFVLLALLAASKNTLQPVQLQKSLFLFGQQHSDLTKDFYEFQPYHYGPFSSDIYHDAETLSSEGLVLIDYTRGVRWRNYSATNQGLENARLLSLKIDPEVCAYLKRVVEWTKSLSFSKLIRSIYVYFPEYRVNSVFQNMDDQG